MQPSVGLAIRFHEVRKHFRRRQVLDGLNLEVREGEFFGLVGMNGAGKTTSIKGLLDFSAVDSGRIEIFGVPHTETRARARLVYLPERFIPPYYLLGRDFLRYMAKLHGNEYVEGQGREMCQALDLEPDALARSVREYSKGMAQKLGLVASFLSRRDLFVLDEPMSGLDPKARLLVKRHLLALKRESRSVFFSTHMLTDVEEICDRMGILHRGRLRFAGTPSECRREFGADSLEEAYLRCISTLDVPDVPDVPDV